MNALNDSLVSVFVSFGGPWEKGEANGKRNAPMYVLYKCANTLDSYTTGRAGKPSRRVKVQVRVGRGADEKHRFP